MTLPVPHLPGGLYLQPPWLGWEPSFMLAELCQTLWSTVVSEALSSP